MADEFQIGVKLVLDDADLNELSDRVNQGVSRGIQGGMSGTGSVGSSVRTGGGLGFLGTAAAVGLGSSWSAQRGVFSAPPTPPTPPPPSTYYPRGGPYFPGSPRPAAPTLAATHTPVDERAATINTIPPGSMRDLLDWRWEQDHPNETPIDNWKAIVEGDDEARRARSARQRLGEAMHGGVLLSEQAARGRIGAPPEGPVPPWQRSVIDQMTQGAGNPFRATGVPTWKNKLGSFLRRLFRDEQGAVPIGQAAQGVGAGLGKIGNMLGLGGLMAKIGGIGTAATGAGGLGTAGAGGAGGGLLGGAAAAIGVVGIVTASLAAVAYMAVKVARALNRLSEFAGQYNPAVAYARAGTEIARTRAGIAVARNPVVEHVATAWENIKQGFYKVVENAFDNPLTRMLGGHEAAWDLATGFVLGPITNALRLLGRATSDNDVELASAGISLPGGEIPVPTAAGAPVSPGALMPPSSTASPGMRNLSSAYNINPVFNLSSQQELFQSVQTLRYEIEKMVFEHESQINVALDTAAFVRIY